MNTKVLRLQQALKKAGYDPGPLDGVLGRLTLAAKSRYLVDKSKRPKGPDISAYQPHVDWDRLKANASFVIIRTSASLTSDTKFRDHWTKAKAAGIPRGSYHFFTPWRDPVKQAELIASILGDDLGEAPITLDVESLAPKAKKGQPTPKPVSSEVLRETALKCAESIEILTGQKPIIYTYSEFDRTHKLGEFFGPKGYKVHMADYREGPATSYGSWEMIGHQWIGDEGTYEGVEGPCDCNYLTIPLESYLVKVKPQH